MLTEEQIKKLKKGDIIYLNNYPITFSDTSINAERISAYDNASNCGEGDLCWFTREYLTMQPQPKHDPCRLFRAGDKVRVAEWNGRKDCRNGMEATVLSNERGCFVDIECMIKGGKAELTYPACLLELITQAEELEPYSVYESEVENCFDIIREELCVMSFPFGSKEAGYYRNKLAAKEAAEAERDRLNEEWRKEHAND